MFVKLSDHPWCTKQSRIVPLCLWSCLTTLEVLNSLILNIMFVKLSDHHWGTKQSLFVPSCLWSCLTTLEVLNSLTLSHRVCEVVWQPLKYKTVYLCPIVFVKISEPLRYQTVSLCHIVFVKLSNNPWCTKQSHFVTSCFWKTTTFEVLNSLTLFHRVCEVVLQPLMY